MTSPRSAFTILNAVFLGLVLGMAEARAAAPADETIPEIHIDGAKGPITIDGDLSDEGWRNATRVERWFEVLEVVLVRDHVVREVDERLHVLVRDAEA